jgi:Spy/CpxP family protein refolding chaperone
MSFSKSLTAVRPGRAAMRLFIGSLLVATSAAVVLPAFAQGPGHHGGPGHGAMGGPGGAGAFGGSPRHMERLLDSVGATDAQKAQIKQILDASRADMRKQHEAARALHDKTRQVLTAPTIDTNAAEQLRQQMLAQHDQASRRGLQTMIDVAQVLTPEQRAKVGEQMAQRQSRMQERMQRMQRDGMPPKS